MWLFNASPRSNKNPLDDTLHFSLHVGNKQVICLISSPTPATQTLMPCLWSGGSCSSLSRATFGGSGTGIWKVVIQRWHPVTGRGFPTTLTPPLKTSQGIFGSFKVGSEDVLAVVFVVYGFMWTDDQGADNCADLHKEPYAFRPL